MRVMRASSLWHFSGKLLGSPASGHKLPIAVQRKKPPYSRAEASSGRLWGRADASERRDYATNATDHAAGYAHNRR